MLPQWQVKDPGHSAKSAGGRLHISTHTPLTQRSRSGLTMPLSRHSVGINGISVLELSSTSKKKKKNQRHRAENDLLNRLPNSSHARKKPATTTYQVLNGLHNVSVRSRFPVTLECRDFTEACSSRRCKPRLARAALTMHAVGSFSLAVSPPRPTAVPRKQRSPIEF